MSWWTEPSLILIRFHILNQSPQTDESHAFEHSGSSITATKAMLIFSPSDCPSCSHLWTIFSSWLEFTPTSPSLPSAQETGLWTAVFQRFLFYCLPFFLYLMAIKCPLPFRPVYQRSSTPPSPPPTKPNILFSRYFNYKYFNDRHLKNNLDKYF